MFCLDVTKIVFPLIPPLLNGKGSRVLDTSTTQTVITCRDDGHYSRVNQGNRSESVWMCVHHMSKWSQHHTNSGVQISSSNVISSVYAAER